MKSLLGLLVALALFANVLDLPVEYDPFYKASKIIQHTKKGRKNIQPLIKPFYLYAIFNNQAYINGKFYQIGEQVEEGYRLISIKKNYVILKKGEQMKLLPLLKSSILQIRE